MFVDAEDVMRAWGNMKPQEFLKLVVFGKHNKRSGLRAYQRNTGKLAQTGDPECVEQIDFSNFITEDGEIDPDCIKYLSFKFSDVERYEQENPSMKRFAEWRRSVETPNASTSAAAHNPVDQSCVEKQESHRQRRGERHEGASSEQDDRELMQRLGLEDSDTPDSCEIDPKPLLDANAGEALDASGRLDQTPNQKAKQRCRAIAALIVSQRPELRPSQIAECIYIKDFGTRLKKINQGIELYEDGTNVRKETICKWIKDLCQNNPTGPPSKTSKLTEITIDINLTEKNPAKS